MSPSGGVKIKRKIKRNIKPSRVSVPGITQTHTHETTLETTIEKTMNLHEYQAKQLFRDYGLPLSQGKAVDTLEAALAAVAELGGKAWALKVQIHAGGRGKAGGVKLVSSTDEIEAFVTAHLGSHLVTAQTNVEGQLVNKIYVEACVDIAQELYLGAVIDRASRRVIFMASTEGGVDIETVAADMPEKIVQVSLDPLTGASPFQGRELAFQLGLEGPLINQFTRLYMQLARLFHECDLSMLEINPLIITTGGDLHCLDAKVSVDDNALYRQEKLASMRDRTQEDALENQASDFNLNYVALEGNIGCMVNGAGLAMGTMDLVKLHGGAPANFLDVGGGATKEAVREAFKIVLSDKEVNAVLINIFGGIVQCAIIAEGIIGAVKEVGVKLPVVVRFEGNQAAEGLARLKASDVDIIAASSLTDAVQQVVKLAGVVS